MSVENFSFIFFIIGITTFLIFIYYNTILKKLLKAISYLLDIQSSSDEGVEQKIENIKQQLKKIGILGMSYDIYYLKKRVIFEDQPTGIRLEKNIYYPNIQGYVAIYVKKNRGEYRLINKLILYVITLQIVQAIHADIDKINASFHRIEKLQTYIVHDLRNVLQYFQAMQYNVEHLQSQEDEKKFLTFLKETAQPVNEKVNNLLSLIKIDIDSDKTKEKEEINIKEMILECKTYFKFSCDIKGEATLYTYKKYIQTILNNILANIYDKSFEEKELQCEIRLIDQEDKVLIFVTDSGNPFESPHEVCQPFYTTKEDAMGIGMYQTLSLVEALGGNLKCYNESNKACIKITLPKM